METPFILTYSKLVEKNYENLKEYFLHQPNHFLPLTSLRNEILQNLQLELFQTAIFAINHFLERMIKLALIEKYTLGLDYSNHETYNEKTLEAVDLYDNLILFKSLDAAEEQNLISASEKIILNELRQKIRNPFSHAEIKKILGDAPQNFTGFMFNIEDVKEALIKGEPIKPGEEKEITSFSATISQLYQQSYSREIAHNYFNTVYNIMINIDKRLVDLCN